MCKRGIVIFRKIIYVLALSLLFSGKVQAGSDALSQPQTVTAGERVANYLQSLMGTASAILVAQKPGDLLNGFDVYRVGVTYNPDEKVIDISVVGSHDDLQIAQQKLELTQKLVMSFNKKIQKNFGVTLGEDDFIMDYLDAKTSRIILKYRNGNFEFPAKAAAEKTLGLPMTPSPAAAGASAEVTPGLPATPTP